MAWRLGLATIALLAAAVAARHHPLWQGPMLGLVVLVTLAGWRRPQWLLPGLMAALPLAQFAPWTGWNVLTEFDLLVLAGAAGGWVSLGLRGAPLPPPLPAAWRGMAALVMAFGVLALWRGVVDAGGLVWAIQTQHTDAMAALLAFKPLVLVALLWPVLRLQVEADAGFCLRGMALGMCLGVAVVCAAVLWERLAMVGLADFSRPYRAVGLFWEMHVGGAAIDAYLALTMPFVVWGVWAARGPVLWLLAAALAVAAGYACLTTFSRGVYGAVLLPLPWLGWLLWQRQHSGPSFVRSAAAATAATAAVATVVVVAYGAVGGWAAAGVGALGAAGLAWWARHTRASGSWRRWAGRGLAVVLVLEVLAVVGFGNFLVDRLKKADHDLGDRWAHWTQGVQLLQGPADWLLGIGLGRLPAHLSRFAPGYELSGGVVLQPDLTHGAAVRLAGPPSRRTLAGQFAITQRVALVPGRFYRVEMDYDVRARTDLGLSVCEMHLLYERRCQLRWMRLAPGQTTWQHLAQDLRGPALGVGLPWAPRQAVFQITVLDEGRDIRLANLKLQTADGQAVLRNGGFEHGLERWLPLATGYFQPWHIDNLYLETLIERGALTLVLAGALLLAVVSRLARQVVSGEAPAEVAFLLAGLVGGGLVGLMSSVLDTGRPALLLTLLAAMALAVAGRAAGPLARPQV